MNKATEQSGDRPVNKRRAIERKEERRLDRRAGGSLELPANKLLKEKEWDPQNRRSAATVEGVSMDEHGTEGAHLRAHMQVHL